jgi:NAD(P)-dependent dehydrogenase (short-subunit alcohol dehydrogenase family)
MSGRDLAGKTIVVTGAESGIGREIALECARQGANVTIAGIQEYLIEEVVIEIGQLGQGSALGVRTDVSVEADVKAMFRQTLDQFEKLDGVVANAGISGPAQATIEISLAEWERMIAVNLTGVFLTCREAAEILIRQGRGGSIIGTGSSAAVRMLSGRIPYIAAKSGVHGMMNALALELAPHKIRVNTLIPGTTATPLVKSIPGHIEATLKTVPMGEIVEPEEIARYVAFVLSDAVPHLTGSQLKVDSGRTVA